MTLFEELDSIFSSHTHYYSVGVPTMNDALERCARLTGGSPQVINYAGQMILAADRALGNQISWLTEIPRPELPAQITAETDEA